MALQDGFKVLALTIANGGTGYDADGEGEEFVLRMRAPGSHSIGVGDGFTGTYSVSSGPGPIDSVTITAAGKNYSSGSWAYSTHGTAIAGEFCSISIHGSTKNQPATGTGAIIIPRIGQDTSMSFSDINVERGLAYNTANSDIHDLYEDYSSIAGTTHTDLTGKPNFDWFQGGPKSASVSDGGAGGVYQSHPIRLDEFYGSNYSQYGGLGCLGLGTPITLSNGNTVKIENVNVGDMIKSATVPGMPLDFDDEDTWSEWSGVPHGNAPNNVWATAYYDIQESNRANPQTAEVMDIYFDYYDNYYLVNGSLKVTYEHPFFVLRDGKYYFKTTASLLVGDKLFKDNNEFEEISSIEFVNAQLETVNLNVEALDVYFGGGYLMHNVHGK
tara:strand:+ start:1372 stop:2526 length:1155 start_codon:yes stop_codon:yes gene_type:complete